MVEEVYLRETKKVLGPCLPIIQNKQGMIADGKHRAKDPRWPRITKDMTEEEVHEVRLVVNTQRRRAGEDDYNEYAAFLRKKYGGKQPWLLTTEKGETETIVARIVRTTGIPERTVQENLDVDNKFHYKGPQGPKKSAVSAVLGKGVQVRIPKKWVGVVTDLVEEAKAQADKNPGMTPELVSSVRSKLRRQVRELSGSEKLPDFLKGKIQGGKLSLEIAVLIDKEIPEVFMEKDTETIIRKKMTLPEAETYIISQKPFYRAREKNEESTQPKTRKPQADYDIAYPFLDLELQIESIHDDSIWYSEHGETHSLRQRLELTLEELLVKSLPGDLLTVHFALRHQKEAPLPSA